MKTNAPKSITWIVAVILGVLGLLGMYGIIAPLAAFADYLLTAGFAILALATTIKGM